MVHTNRHSVGQHPHRGVARPAVLIYSFARQPGSDFGKLEIVVRREHLDLWNKQVAHRVRFSHLLGTTVSLINCNDCIFYVDEVSIELALWLGDSCDMNIAINDAFDTNCWLLR